MRCRPCARLASGGMTETKITETKTIAVVGAAGATGGGLARAILADPEGGFACRAITRTPDSAAARALADQGATVVRADLDDVDSLVSAFEGAYGAFCLTSFFEHFDAEREATQSANLARAAAAARVGHAIWSTAEDTRRRYPLADDRMPTLQSRFKVPQWDAKSEGEVRFDDAGRPHDLPAHPLPLGSVGVRPRAPQPGPDCCSPQRCPIGRGTAATGIAAEDIGRCAYGVSPAARSSSERPSGRRENTPPASGSQPDCARVRRASALPVAASGGVPLPAVSRHRGRGQHFPVRRQVTDDYCRLRTCSSPGD